MKGKRRAKKGQKVRINRYFRVGRTPSLSDIRSVPARRIKILAAAFSFRKEGSPTAKSDARSTDRNCGETVSRETNRREREKTSARRARGTRPRLALSAHASRKAEINALLSRTASPSFSTFCRRFFAIPGGTEVKTDSHESME